MQHRWVSWLLFLAVMVIGLVIGFSNWRSPAKINKSRRNSKNLANSVSKPFGNRVYTTNDPRHLDQKKEPPATSSK